MPDVKSGAERNVLTLSDDRESWEPTAEDYTNYSLQPYVQEMAERDAPTREVSSGPEDTVDPVILFPHPFYLGYRPENLDSALKATRADQVLNLMFRKFLKDGNSPARALSAMITLVSSMAYYDTAPLFNFPTDTMQTRFMTVLYPTGSRGLAAFLTVLVVHLLLVAISTIAFIRHSRISMIGNYWQAVAHLQSPQTEVAESDTMLKDQDFVKRSQRTGTKYARIGLGTVSEGGEDGEVRQRVEFVRRR
jgi:hypothetical protein